MFGSDLEWSGVLDWIGRATRGLSAESSARVRAEILEHCESARQEQLARGVQPAEAARIALTSLGDARKANRQYRKVLLTAAEEKWLKDFAGAPSQIFAWGSLLFFPASAGGFYAIGNVDSVWVSLLLIPWTVLTFPHWFHRNPTSRRIRQFRYARYLGWGIAALAIPYDPGGIASQVSPLLVIQLLNEWRGLGIRRKLAPEDRPGWLRY